MQELEEDLAWDKGGADDVADETDEKAERAAHGTYSVMSNGYFTLVNDPNYPDCKMRILPRWRVKGELGDKLMSKTATIADYDRDQENPILTYLVLRAWMIYRFQFAEFVDAKASRKALLRRWEHQLMVDIANLGVGNGGTGNKLADDKMRKWAPQCLPEALRVAR